MLYIRQKKSLGQHFLKDKNIAKKIVSSLMANNIKKVIEVGPGKGILTRFLVEEKRFQTFVIEIDKAWVEYLTETMPHLKTRIYHDNFLQFDLKKHFNESIAIIGNFPYNISSQIFFKILENRDIIMESVAMVQKEVAKRIEAKPGNKTYGILSVLLQAYYNIKYLFTVNENVFYPPPKIKSAVIRLTRNEIKKLNCNEDLFFRIVKTGFNQRRKTLRNSLKSILLNLEIKNEIMSKRPEQLSIQEFVRLTTLIEDKLNQSKIN